MTRTWTGTSGPASRVRLIRLDRSFGRAAVEAAAARLACWREEWSEVPATTDLRLTAVRPLAEIVASPDEPIDVRIVAAHALGSIGDDAPFPAASRLREGLFPCLVPDALVEILATP